MRRGTRSAGRLGRGVLVLGWVVAVAMAVAALCRIVDWDGAEPFVVLNTLSWYLYLPAWPIAAIAEARRHLALAAVCLAVAAAQAAFVLPELTAARALPAWAADAPRLVLLDGNVYDENPSMAGYEAQIRSLSPDLVTLEEAIPPDVAQLEASGALDRLRYRFSIDRFDPWAVLVASRYRLGPVRVVSMFGRPLVVQTSLELPGGALALWVVHTTAPLAGAEVQWSAQLARVAALLAARRTERLLVTGDFNATWGNRGFARILGTGLADGAAARGDPFEMTWSQLLGPLPPLVRIDHVLTAPGVSVLAIRTATGVGSDHRVLVATIAVRERPRAGRA